MAHSENTSSTAATIRTLEICSRKFSTLPEYLSTLMRISRPSSMNFREGDHHAKNSVKSIKKASLRLSLQAGFSGGGGDRTRVPWYFDDLVYTLSLFFDGVLPLFASLCPNRRGRRETIGQIF